jgi:hypothetical protein
MAARLWVLVALGAGGLIALPAAAQLNQWKWRDAQGQLQYSDRPPPPSVPAKDILQKPVATARPAAPAANASAASGPAAAASAPRTADPELTARRRDAEAAERKAAEDKLTRERQESCTRARDYLRTLESGLAIARVNAQGERVSLGEAERRLEVNRAREVMAADCR